MIIQAKFYGVCKVCGKRYAPDSRVWHEQGRGLVHVECDRVRKTEPQKTKPNDDTDF